VLTPPRPWRRTTPLADCLGGGTHPVPFFFAARLRLLALGRLSGAVRLLPATSRVGAAQILLDMSVPLCWALQTNSPNGHLGARFGVKVWRFPCDLRGTLLSLPCLFDSIALRLLRLFLFHRMMSISICDALLYVFLCFEEV